VVGVYLTKLPPHDFILNSVRFSIRRLLPSDAQLDLVDWILDPLAAEMLNAKPKHWSIEEQQSYFASYEREKAKILLGVFTKDENKLIGLYIVKFNVDAAHFTLSTLIGNLEWRGKAASAEASDAICSFFFNELDYLKIKANVRPQNKAMLWLLLTNGWTKEAHLTKHLVVDDGTRRDDVLIFGLLAREWRDRNSKQ
jgi:RimJ/RimL family protein N-acetyltransferase